jgi:ABC-type polysaccharide/polyol phosphate export permease
MIKGNTKKIDRVFFKNLVVRQIRQDYLENLTGFAWLILQPLILLAVYTFVFSGPGRLFPKQYCGRTVRLPRIAH